MGSRPLDVLRDFAAFLRRPQVLAPVGLLAPGAPRQWGVMTVLQVAGLALLLPLLHLWQKHFGLPAPTAFENIPVAWLPLIVVVIAPPLEELLFRGWQSGRARSLWLLIGSLMLVATLLTVRPENIEVTGTALLVLALGTTGGWFWLRKRLEPMGWFATIFPAIFYLVVIGFAAMHLLNYPSISLLALPLVLPQAWAGLTLGYVRQRIGLVGAILAHATSNGLALGVAMLGGG